MLQEIVDQNQIDLNNPSSVFIGRDTRKSSPSLAQAVRDGVNSVNGVMTDFGVVSTPQLHYNVVCQNTDGAYGQVGEEGYFKKLTDAFKKIRGSVSDTLETFLPLSV